MRRSPLVLSRQLCEDVKVHQNAMEEADVFGVELELEGRGLHSQDLETIKYFTTHMDNSLRNIRPDSESLEYVFKAPLNYPTTIKAVRSLFDYLNSDKSEVFDSYRTSFHVHLNFGRETMLTIYNFITLSIVFDELFVSQNGEHRVGNNFCLRAVDAEDQIFSLIQAIEHYGSFWHIKPNDRYSSVNFASLLKFGTIEFRSMECTTDFARIKHWIDTLQRMKESARTFKNPQEILHKFSMMDAEDFMKMILGGSYKFYSGVPEWKGMLDRGVRLAQEFAFCCTWVDTTEGGPKPKHKGLFVDQPFHEQVLAQMVAAQEAADAGFLANHGAQWDPQPQPFPDIDVEDDNVADVLADLEEDDEDEDDF